MVELICRNEPRHFFCLHNVLKLFEKEATIDVKSVYKALKTGKKCLAFQSKFCPVSENNKPCSLLRTSHDSIIREQLYALEGLNFIHRIRSSRKLIFKITQLGRKAVKQRPVLLPPTKIKKGEYETDLSKPSSRKWVENCRKGLASYGPFVSYLWKLKCGKDPKSIRSEIGDRAVNTFDLWARECGFRRDGRIRTPRDLFNHKIRIRNWITRIFRNEPPPYQEYTAQILFKFKKAKLTNEVGEIPQRWSKKRRDAVLLNIENSGIIIEEVSKNEFQMRNDFDFDEYRASIKDAQLLRRLHKSVDSAERSFIEKEAAAEKIKFSMETETKRKEKQSLLELIRRRSKENQKRPPRASRVKGTRLQRDHGLYAAVKQFHNFRCQVYGCNFTFRKNNGEYYCETAHIKPFSSSKDDTAENLLVLCANCHRMLDQGDKKTRKRILEKVEASRQAMLKKLSQK